MGKAGVALDEQSVGLLENPLAQDMMQVAESELYSRTEKYAAAVLAAEVLELRGLAEIVHRNPTCGGDKAAAAWLHHHSGMLLFEARATVTFAVRICSHPKVLKAYAKGKIGRREAKSILDFLAHPPKAMPKDFLPGVRDRLLKAARSRKLEDLRGEEGRIRDAFSAGQPPAEDHERNELFLDSGLYGRWFLRGELDAETAAKLQTALSPFSAPRPEPDGAEDARSAPLRRADALEMLLDRFLAQSDRPSQNGERPRMTVHIPLEDIFGGVPSHAERERLIKTGQIDAVLAASPVGWNQWMRAVSLATAQRIACDCQLLMVGADDSGAPLVVGVNERLASLNLRRALAHRDRGCAFPHCNRPALWTQSHHIVLWEAGGETQIDNLVALCGEHHRAVHHHGWTVVMAANRHPIFRPPKNLDPLRLWRDSAGALVDEAMVPAESAMA